MSTSTDYRTREADKRARQAERRNGRKDKLTTVSAFTKGLQKGMGK